MTADEKVNQLVVSVNDVAQTARTVSLGLMFVIAVMFATVVATTDEAVIRDSVTVVPQLGVRISVSLAYLLAPVVFLFLHVSALLQLDLLDQRLLSLEALIKSDAPNDMGHHLQRLNSFIATQIGAAGNADPLIRACIVTISWVTFVGIPLTLLLAIQIGYVRSQSFTITHIHQFLVGIDAIILVAVLRRGYQRRGVPPSSRRSTLNYAFVGLIIFVSWFLANPPAVDSTSAYAEVPDIRWSESRTFKDNRSSFVERAIFPILAGHNPLDVLLCRETAWGCRYLSVDKAALIREDAPVSAVEAILNDPSSKAEIGEDPGEFRLVRLRTIAVSIKNSNLRFADFTESVLYGADLGRNDLRGAAFDGAHMIGVRLDSSELEGGSFGGAQLQQASMKYVNMTGVYTANVNLKDAKLRKAILDNANLSEAVNLTQEQIDEAFCNEGTKLPQGLNKDKCIANKR